MIGGVFAVVLWHVVLPVAAITLLWFFRAIGVAEDPAKAKPPMPERTIVEARFVKLGKKLDPRKLPNRKVPVASTRTPSGIAVSKTPAEHRERPDAGPQTARRESILAQLGNRADQFAEFDRVVPEQEGNEQGIEEGTETEARAGDLYGGQLYMFFRRGWTVPNVISTEERKLLVAEVDVQIGQDRSIGGWSVRRGSGNALFDQSVMDRLQALKDSNAQVPEPPAEIAADYLGQTIGVDFKGRSAR